MLADVIGLVVAAHNGVGLRGIGGDGRAFGDAELLALAVFVGGVLFAVVRGSRLTEGPKGRPFKARARRGGRRGSPPSHPGARPGGPR